LGFGGQIMLGQKYTIWTSFWPFWRFRALFGLLPLSGYLPLFGLFGAF